MADRPDDPPPYNVYRSRPRFLDRLDRDGAPARGRARPPQDDRPRRRLGLPRRRGGRRIGKARVALWLVGAVAGWVALSAVLFVVSATVNGGGIDSGANRVLGGGGLPPFSPTTVLVLGSDRRSDETKEPGGSTTGPSRADSIVLMRMGGGRSSRLSIPRDTVADIPGVGRAKVNAAFAAGGSELMVETLEGFLGLEINHVIEVSFENFPELIDAMGGVVYRGGCVVSRINGGFRNGGYTLRLKGGKTTIDGRQALALARTRKNECNPRESDLTRASRQQKIVSAMRSRILSPTGFVRLPWIAWKAPSALVTDMSGPTLMGFAAASVTGGSPPTRILRPSGVETLPDGGSGLVVSEERRRRAAQRFLDG
jgi:LCP family protein required for cell wall assembly